jgi:hypothetical protein
MKRDIRNLIKELKSSETEITTMMETLEGAKSQAFSSNSVPQSAYYNLTLILSHLRKAKAIVPQLIKELTGGAPV